MNLEADEEMDEAEAMFSARFNDFEIQNRRASKNKMVRNEAIQKKVSETYHIKRALREKEEEERRLEKEMR